MRRAVPVLLSFRVSLVYSMLATVSLADQLGGGDPVDRGGNRISGWCPSELWYAHEFTATGPSVFVEFKAQTHTTIDFVCTEFEEYFADYMSQGLDNVMIVEKTAYLANLDSIANCCLDPVREIFRFDLVDPAAVVFSDFFDSEISADWITHDVYFDALSSAQADLSLPDCGGTSDPGGSLRFGREQDEPDCVRGYAHYIPERGECCLRDPQFCHQFFCATADDSIGIGPLWYEECRRFASAGITVNGLQAGTDYVLAYWWKSPEDFRCSDEGSHRGPVFNGNLWATIYDVPPDCDLSPSQVGLSGHDSDAGDRFGESVSASGNALLVGAPGWDNPGYPALEDAASAVGKVYVFRRLLDSWSAGATMNAPDEAAGDEFGAAVSLSGDVALIGAPLDDDDGDGSGSVYVFTGFQVCIRDTLLAPHASGIARWTFSQKLTASDAGIGDRFGRSVGSTPGMAVVGAPFDNDFAADAGAVYVYRWNGTTWVEEQKLTASDPVTDAHFGIAVAASGDVVVVGSDVGAAYVLRRAGSNWVEEQKLVVPEVGVDSDAVEFGVAVAVEGDVIIIGAPGFDAGCPPMTSCDDGAAFVFRYDGVSGQWLQEGPNLTRTVSGERFGSAVAIRGDRVIVGAPFNSASGQEAGAAYEFELIGSTWSHARTISGNDPGGRLGTSAAMSGGGAVAGASLADVGGIATGEATGFNLGFDCNGNGLEDLCEIAAGMAEDANANGVPDPCERTSDAHAEQRPVPTAFRLFANHPNPFNPGTVIEYELPRRATVNLRIYDVAGRSVRLLERTVTRVAGRHRVHWDGRDDSGQRTPSGIYFYELRAGGFRQSRKMVLVQ